MFNKTFVLTATIILLIASQLSAAPSVHEPEINAESAIMIDAETGIILYEKNADTPIPPASMTKLMTIHTALGIINEKKIPIDSIVPISSTADFRSLPPRSSLMFIEKGQKVTLFELLLGLALPSGNDAGVAVAEFLADNVVNFVKLMNAEAGRLGLVNTHFDDSSGYSEKNMTTAREFASFCRVYIEQNRSYMDKLHLPLSFTYPEAGNLPASGESVYGPVTQSNHNLLIGRMAGVDGLKTGYIDESGYNFAGTAAIDGRRLILVTMGGPGKSAYDGSVRRVIDAAVLFSYGFYAWTKFTPQVPGNESIPVRGGSSDSLETRYSQASEILIKTAEIDALKFRPFFHEIELPVNKGELIGRWELLLGNEVLQQGVITASETVEKGNIFKRLSDFFRN